MKQKLVNFLVILIFIITNYKSSAQSADSYSFFTSTGNALDVMTGAATAVSSNTDDTPSGAITIPGGMSFSFEGVGYTTFSVSPDGWLRLGSAGVAEYNNNITSATNRPKIMPYWDDLATGTNGAVTYVVTGTAPNRILKIQWRVTIPWSTTGASNSTFQAWLYETGGVIEFRYGTMGAASMSASVGIGGANSTNYRSVNI